MISGILFKFVSDISNTSRERNLLIDSGNDLSGLHLKISHLSDIKLLKESGKVVNPQLNNPISTTLPFWILIPNDVSLTSRIIGKPLCLSFFNS